MSVLSSAVLFAMLAGASAATWTLCLKLGSAKVTAALGALVVTGGALVVNALVLLTMRARGHDIVGHPQGLWLMALAGLAAAGVDIFSGRLLAIGPIAAGIVLLQTQGG